MRRRPIKLSALQAQRLTENFEGEGMANIKDMEVCHRALFVLGFRAIFNSQCKMYNARLQGGRIACGAEAKMSFPTTLPSWLRDASTSAVAEGVPWQAVPLFSGNVIDVADASDASDVAVVRDMRDVGQLI